MSCNIGGYVIAGRSVPRCTRPVTHRFRAALRPEEPWGYRCGKHVGLLDTGHCLIELVGAEVPT